MKLLTFKHLGLSRLGWLLDDEKTVLSTDPQDSTMPHTIMDVIVNDAKARQQLTSNKDHLERFNLNEIKVIEPIEPNGILCVARNYTDPDAEDAATGTKYPMLFWRLPRNHVAEGEPLLIPASSNTLDWEGELVVVIGKGGRHIMADNAMDHVFGYSIYNEGTVRDYQDHSSQLGLSKNFQASASFGPYIVTADQFGDPYQHEIKTTVDGEVMQSASVSLMWHKIEQIIEYLSSSMELLPGDIICSGTPAGIGGAMDPPRYLQDGETVEVSISGIGTLTNPVRNEN